MVPVDEPIELDPPPAGEPIAVCRNATIEQGRSYFSRLLALNGAEPSVVAQVRSPGFVVDDTFIPTYLRTYIHACRCAHLALWWMTPRRRMAT